MSIFVTGGDILLSNHEWTYCQGQTSKTSSY